MRRDDRACLRGRLLQTGLTQKIVNRRIADGTKNLAKEPAMTEDETLRAIRTGMEAVEAIKRCGYDIFGVGEMGIGNTTTSACVLAALCGRSGAEVVGAAAVSTTKGSPKKSALWTKPRGDLIPLMSSAFLPRLAALTSARWSAPSSALPITSFRQSSTATSPLSRRWQRVRARAKSSRLSVRLASLQGAGLPHRHGRARHPPVL